MLVRKIFSIQNIVIIDLIFIAERWCAKIYKHGSFDDLMITTGITTDGEMSSENNDETSSVKVDEGCTLTLFKDYRQEGLLGTHTEDSTSLGDYNDQVSSYTCDCQGNCSAF